MMRCVLFRPYEKNTLKGFVDLELSRVGLALRDCTGHDKNGKEWISFPARSYEGDGGTTRWQPLIEFSQDAGAAREQFQRQAIEAVHAAVAGQERGRWP